MPKPVEPPTEFLLMCSAISLVDFELSRLNAVANLRKQLRLVEEELLRAEAEALVARWLAEHREELLELGRTQALQKTLDFVSDPWQKPAAPLGAKHRRYVDAAD